MKKHHLLSIVTVVLFSLFISCEARAQSNLRKTEIGVLVTVIDLNDSVREKPIGVGGRFAYNFNDNLALDTELAYYPEGPQGNNGQTQALAGLRAGARIKQRVGLFAKVRPGVVRFGGSTFKALNNGARNNFAVDVGGILELYPSSRAIVRIDWGDTIIPFGNDPIFTGVSLMPKHPGTTHNYQTSFGVGFRF